MFYVHAPRGRLAITVRSRRRRTFVRRLVTVITVLSAVVALSGLGIATQSGLAGAAQTPASNGAPCGTMPRAATHYSHVIWIWMENHSYGDIMGSPSAPYINFLAAECGLATDDHNISHPSLPNYIAATSGLPYAGISKFDGDCSVSPSCSTSAPSIFGQGETWKSYEEDMPSNCYGGNTSLYAIRHNPAPYYSTLSGCATNDVPYTQLSSDLAGGTLPAFSFITPNLTDDMHNGTVADGDTWLLHNLPTITSSSEYTSGTTAVFITWDEGEGGTTNQCADNSTDVGCHITTLVVSPSTVPGTQSLQFYNHYSLLGTAEKLLHLPALGLASAYANMVKNFNL
jgi:phosphatidylinositol-3-phosphatase